MELIDAKLLKGILTQLFRELYTDGVEKIKNEKPDADVNLLKATILADYQLTMGVIDELAEREEEA